MGERALTATIIIGERGTPDQTHFAAVGLEPNEARQWLDRAIIALGAERTAMAKCRLHGELSHAGFEERCDSDDIELAAAMERMYRAARGWRKHALYGAMISLRQDARARRIIRDAAKHIEDRQ